MELPANFPRTQMNVVLKSVVERLETMPLSKKLDLMVSSGGLTRAQADKVLAKEGKTRQALPAAD